MTLTDARADSAAVMTTPAAPAAPIERENTKLSNSANVPDFRPAGVGQIIQERIEREAGIRGPQASTTPSANVPTFTAEGVSKVIAARKEQERLAQQANATARRQHEAALRMTPEGQAILARRDSAQAQAAAYLAEGEAAVAKGTVHSQQGHTEFTAVSTQATARSVQAKVAALKSLIAGGIVSAETKLPS